MCQPVEKVTICVTGGWEEKARKRKTANLRPLTQERPQIAEIVIAFHLRECDRQ